MTPKELDMARRAAARFIAPPQDPNQKPARKSPRIPGYNQAELKAKFIAANDAYEAGKKSGVNIAMVEEEFGLNPHSLKSWRSRRMISGDHAIKRIYVNRPLKTKP